MADKHIRVGALCEPQHGMASFKRIVEEGLGNFFALYSGNWDIEMLRDICEYARKNNCLITCPEMIRRLTGNWNNIDYPELDKMIALFEEYSDVVDGFKMLGEYGGVRFYWPTSSLELPLAQLPEEEVCGMNTFPKPAADYIEAEKDVIDTLKQTIERVKARGVKAPITSVEAHGLAIHFYHRGGIKRMFIEMIYRDTELEYSCVNGSAKAFGSGGFGVDLATLWYGGNIHDELWFKRWRTSLYHAYLRGADPIYAEHGILGWHGVLGNTADSSHPNNKRFCKELGDFYSFTKENPRREGLPQAVTAVMQGRLDGYTGADQTHLWGLRKDDSFRIGAPDTSWALFDSLYRKRVWENRNQHGEADFSGNPPLGQTDIIPYDIPDEVLAAYKVVIFLGRNSMDDALYQKLLRYVEQGGELLMTAAHLDTSVKPGEKFTPYNGGDWKELFGVEISSDKLLHPFGVKYCGAPDCRWQLPLWSANCDPKHSGSGFNCCDLKLSGGADVLAAGSSGFNDQLPGSPAELSLGEEAEKQAWSRMTEYIITGKKVGKGYAVLVNSLDHPGVPAMTEMYTLLMQAACDANRPYPRVACSDRIRYAVYPGEPAVLYLLNTEPELGSEAVIYHSPERKEKIFLNGGEFKQINLL